MPRALDIINSRLENLHIGRRYRPSTYFAFCLSQKSSTSLLTCLVILHLSVPFLFLLHSLYTHFPHLRFRYTTFLIKGIFGDSCSTRSLAFTLIKTCQTGFDFLQLLRWLLVPLFQLLDCSQPSPALSMLLSQPLLRRVQNSSTAMATNSSSKAWHTSFFLRTLWSTLLNASLTRP